MCGEYEACSNNGTFCMIFKSNNDVAIGSVLFFPDYGLCNCTEFTNTVTVYNSTECEPSTEIITYSVTLEYLTYEGSSLTFTFCNGSVYLFRELDTCYDFMVETEYPAL